jgi:hypothetical protein
MSYCYITGIKPDEIDILVTTSSVFAPTPSVASMLINMFKMREDVQVRASSSRGQQQTEVPAAAAAN